jgi:ABC-type transport system involved in Fe-S cluster assembly, permease component
VDQSLDFSGAKGQTYAANPFEKNELYKKYYLKIDPSEFDLTHTRPADKACEEKVNALSKELRIRFDLVIYNGIAFPPTNQNISVIHSKSATAHEMDLLKCNDEQDKLAEFASSNFRDGIIISSSKDKAETINIVVMNDSNAFPNPIAIDVVRDSALTINEFYYSELKESAISTTTHKISIGGYGKLEMNAIHMESAKSVVMGLAKADVGPSASLNLNTIYIGSGMIRNRSELIAKDTGADISSKEAILGKEGQRFDVLTYINNSAQKTNCNSETHAVLMDKSIAYVKGFAKIIKGAGGSKSFVKERGIIYGKDAVINLIPDMSIDEGDVKATHSSAVAPIDQESIFYMCSRGIEEKKSKYLIANGFLNEIIGHIKDNPFKVFSASLIDRVLQTKEIGIPKNLNVGGVWMDYGSVDSSTEFRGAYKFNR